MENKTSASGEATPLYYLAWFSLACGIYAIPSMLLTRIQIGYELAAILAGFSILAQGTAPQNLRRIAVLGLTLGILKVVLHIGILIYIVFALQDWQLMDGEV